LREEAIDITPLKLFNSSKASATPTNLSKIFALLSGNGDELMTV